MTKQFKRTGRFTSRHDAIQRRVQVWTCLDCGAQHKEAQPFTCRGCASQNFHRFDSHMEANRFAQLRLMEMAGMVRNIRCQVPFALYVDDYKITTTKIGKPLTTYYADFVYEERKGSGFDIVVEDCKGHKDFGQTDVFKLKRKMVEACFGAHSHHHTMRARL